MIFVEYESPFLDCAEWRSAKVVRTYNEQFEVVVDGDHADLQEYTLEDEGKEWRWPPTRIQVVHERVAAAKLRPLPPDPPDDFPSDVYEMQVYERGGWWPTTRSSARDRPGLFGVEAPSDDGMILLVTSKQLRPHWLWDGEMYVAKKRPLLLTMVQEEEEVVADEKEAEDDDEDDDDDDEDDDDDDDDNDDDDDDNDDDDDDNEVEEEAAEEEDSEVDSCDGGPQLPRRPYDRSLEQIDVLLHKELSKEQKDAAMELLRSRFASKDVRSVIPALVDKSFRHPDKELKNYNVFAGDTSIVNEQSQKQLQDLHLALTTHAEHGIVGAACVTLHRTGPRGPYWCAVVQLFAVVERWEGNGIASRLNSAIEEKARELGAERLLVPSAEPCGRRNWWQHKGGFDRAYAVTCLARLPKEPKQLVMELPPSVFLPFSIAVTDADQLGTTLMFKRLDLNLGLGSPASSPASSPTTSRAASPDLSARTAAQVPRPRPAEAGPAAAAPRPASRNTKRAAASRGGSSKKRPRTASSSSAAAASSAGGRIPVASRRVVRKLVFGEFFAGCCRKTMAMRGKGWDVFSIELNQDVVEGDMRDSERLIVADVLQINPATLPRCDLIHFSPPCTSTTRLRRADLCGHGPRSEENDWYGEEDDEVASLFNDYMNLILRIIADQSSRKGNEHFRYTVEQPARGNYPKHLIERLEAPVHHRAGCGATRLEITYCKFLSGFYALFGAPSQMVCLKPTCIWTNCPSLIAAWGQGQCYCGFPTDARPECSPCQWFGKHNQQPGGDSGSRGGVCSAPDDGAGRGAEFPIEYCAAYSRLVEQDIGVRRGEPETYAPSDQKQAGTEQNNSVRAFCAWAKQHFRRGD